MKFHNVEKLLGGIAKKFLVYLSMVCTTVNKKHFTIQSKERVFTVKSYIGGKRAEPKIIGPSWIINDPS